jgi:osmotically-inducible protein OsmY
MPRSLASLLAFVTTVALGLALTAPDARAQDRSNMMPRVSPNAAVSQTVGVTEVRVTYGRPGVRGRTIFGDLVPYGEVWRTGANEATTISFSTPVQVEGESLEAGTYGLFTIPGEDTWTIIFNNTADQWGAYNYDESQDALRVEVDSESAATTELMTFAFPAVSDTSATLALRWADVRVPIQLQVDTPEFVRQKANEAAANASNWQTPARYAGYALQNGVLLDDALEWVEASIAQQKTFQNVNLKARLHAATGQYDAAMSAAEEALAMAESMDETPNGVEDLRSAMNEWSSQ